MAAKLAIFANPISGRGRSLRAAEGLLAAAREGGHEARVYTERPGGVDLGAALSGGAVAVVCGGDGTLRGFVSAMAEQVGHEPGPRVMVVATGTANLAARMLGMGRGEWGRPGELLARVVGGGERRVDVAALRSGGGSAGAMLVMASVGFDAEVIRRLEARRRGPIGRMAYLVPVLGALGAGSGRVVVEVEGREVGRGAMLVEVASASEYGAGFALVPGADAGDGVLDVGMFDAASGLRLAGEYARALCGRTPRRLVRGRHVRVTAEAGAVPVQADGEYVGVTPLEVEMTGRQVRLVV